MTSWLELREVVGAIAVARSLGSVVVDRALIVSAGSITSYGLEEWLKFRGDE